MTVSIVIPAYNEADRIDRCLQSIALLRGGRPMEVVVVDDGSTDGTALKARRWKRALPIRVIRIERSGRGKARFIGFQAALGDIILSTDADGIVPSRWVETMLRPFADRSIVAVAGVYRLSELAKSREIFLRFWLSIWPRAMQWAFGQPTFRASNFAVRKNAYEQAGAFDPRLDAYEDLELSLRAWRIGSIVFLPSSVVSCSGRRFKKTTLRAAGEYLTHLWFFLRGGRTLRLSKA